MDFYSANEGNPARCNSIEEARGYYAKWNKQSQKKKYVNILLIWGIQNSQCRMMVASG